MSYESQQQGGHSLTNDLLMQLLEAREADSKILHELKGGIEVRVGKLETAASHNWWATYVIVPLFGLAHGIAAHFGVKI